MSLKLIQVGLGGHGRGVGSHFVAQSPDFVYAGLVDIDPDAVGSFGREHGIAASLQYTDYRQAFRELDADAVLVVAASPVHYDICKAALENGLHVLVEKPFALTLDEAEELVRLAAEKNRNIMVNQNYRFFSSVLSFKQAMQDSSLGNMLFVNVQFYRYHDGKPYQRAMDNYMLLEMGVHHIDMIRFLLDCDIASVRGNVWNSPGSGYRGEPHVHAVYEMESGIPVFYLGTLLAKGPQTPWEGAWKIQYENGALHMDDLGEGFGVYKFGPDQAAIKLPLLVQERQGIHGTLAEFARSIRERREPAASGRDNLKTLAALLATSRSSREGAAIKLLEE